MPRTTEQNEEIRQERCEQILDAALTVYVQKGYAAAEVADVADHAGLARGLVYYYFNSKQALFQALFTWMLDRSNEFARRILLDGDGSPRERLLECARQLCQGTLDDPRHSQFFLRAYQEADQVYKDIERKRSKSGYALRDYIATVIREGIDVGELRPGDPTVAANAYWGALSMNLGELTRTLMDDKAKARAMIEEIVSYSLYGLVDYPCNYQKAQQRSKRHNIG